MSRWRRYTWPAITLLAFAAVALLRAGGQLDFLERAEDDARARLLQHEVDSDIVIVGIDPSASRSSTPGRGRDITTARLIERLAAAERSRSFSTSTSAHHHASSTMRDSRPRSVPGPERRSSCPPSCSRRAARLPVSCSRSPLNRFARHVMLVSANQLLDGDSLVRRFRPTWRDGPHELPSVVRLLYPSLPDEADLPIDYSIAPSSYNYVSYAELLAGRVDAGELRQAARRPRRRDRDRAQRHPRRTRSIGHCPASSFRRSPSRRHARASPARRRNGPNSPPSPPSPRLRRPWADRSAGAPASAG